MKVSVSRRTLILFSAVVAIAITSTSLAQVTIVNQYDMSAASFTPPVHLASGLANTSSVNESTNPTGSAAYVNLTEKITLGNGAQVNLTGLLDLPSSTTATFNYTTNVTTFNGQKTVSSVSLYSLTSNGSNYQNDFTFNSTTGYSNSTAPVSVLGNQNSSIGLLIQLGKNSLGGPYSWSLNFEINGCMTGPDGASVYTQYFVFINVTTVELP